MGQHHDRGTFYGRRPDLIDVREAADILNVSSRTVTRLCALNKIRSVKVGYQWRVNRAALMRYAGLEEVRDDGEL
ncbi:MAG: helix-turn-helix domain-containing protein [Atopobiaceae bacterium]|jgi:excisionase family DNA binding protein|nr:helix-turn-helix domain-containing protein [Atopobiaceae bacterium]MCI1227046.1 helix-turn-helix domain-containing protein [Atopobiaceae bacterium]MCI1259528.1 helix-turn-helix domain-containing protein [Atopobiaceae bacterium]